MKSLVYNSVICQIQSLKRGKQYNCNILRRNERRMPMADNNKKTLSVQNKEHDLKIYRNHKDGLTYEEAVKKSVDECIKENILRDFFTENKAEVISMTIFEYDEEEHMKLEREEQYRKGEEAGEKRGEKKGEEKKLIKQITKKLTKGKSIPQIADELEESEQTIEKLITEIEKINN